MIRAFARVFKSGQRVAIEFEGRAAMEEQLQKEFLKNRDENLVSIEFSEAHKTVRSNKMLRYLYGHLALVAFNYLVDCGWNIATKEEAIEFYKKPLSFTKEWVNESTGETIVEADSVATGDRAAVNKFIQALYLELIESGNRVMLPEEYFKHKK